MSMVRFRPEAPICGFSSSGRASPCQGEGSEFESRNPLHKQKGSIHCFLFLFFGCDIRDSKRPLRSHCIGSNASLSKGGGPRSGGGIVTAFLECFSAATVTTLNQQRKPLRHDFVVPPPLIVEAYRLPFLFFVFGQETRKDRCSPYNIKIPRR